MNRPLNAIELGLGVAAGIVGGAVIGLALGVPAPLIVAAALLLFLAALGLALWFSGRSS